MRKSGYILVALISLACSKQPVVPENGTRMIEFGHPSLQEVKASFIESADDLADGFSVYGLKYLPGQPKTLFMRNVRVYREGGLWKYDGEYYWSPAACHSFFAVYPYCSDTVGEYTYSSTSENDLLVRPKEGTSWIETGTAKSPKDILFAHEPFDTPFDITQKTEMVVFRMRHAFSSVCFDVVNHSDYVIESVAGKIWGSDPEGTLPGLYDVAESVTINDEDGDIEWTNPDVKDTDDEVFAFGNSSMNLAVGGSSTVFSELVIPQNINTSVSGRKDKVYLHLTVIYKGNESNPSIFTVCLSDIELSNQEAIYKKTWLPGRKYRYSLNVTSDFITCGVTLVPWEEDEIIKL